MAISSNALYQALLDRLKAKVTGVHTFTRRNYSPDQFENVKQPAVLVIADQEHPQGDGQLPDKWLLRPLVAIFAKYDNANPEVSLLAIRDQIEAALERQPNEPPKLTAGSFQTTLGGLVYYAKISSIDYTQGAAAEQAIAVIKVEMMAFAG